MSPFARYSQLKCAWPLEWTNVKYKYSNGKAVCNFLFVGNNNVCLVCLRFSNIDSRNVYDIDLDWPLDWTKVKCKYASRENTCDFLCCNSNVCLICCRLRDNHLWTSICSRFESLTLKIKFKDIDYLNENRVAKVSCQYHEYVFIFVQNLAPNGRLLVQLFDCRIWWRTLHLVKLKWLNMKWLYIWWRTNKCTDVLPAKITSRQLHWDVVEINGKKWDWRNCLAKAFLLEWKGYGTDRRSKLQSAHY